MEHWDPKQPEAWAELFSLIAVPMFGPHPGAPAPPKGVHSLMLDGSRGSFILSTEGPKELLVGPNPIRWAWSANVIHTVAIAGEKAIVRRWDSPGVKEWPIRQERDARSLFRSLEQSLEPPTAQSVIARGLKTFRAVRTAIEKQGGSALDVVLAFNTILAWVAQRSDADGDIEIGFADAIRAVHSTGQVSFTSQQVSPDLLDYPIGDLARLLRKGDSSSQQYLLDASLLILYASGPLYQEAHKQLLVPAQQEPQGELWSKEMLLVGNERPRALAPKFVHHTPPSLARVLVEVALQFLEVDGALDVLDPACGSGVLLIEAGREASIQGDTRRTVSLRGFDQSDLAIAMADFCVRNANAENGGQTVAIHPQNSLATSDWGAPQIIAMNPPFVAWENLSHSDRDLVQGVLGSLHRGRPDLAFAFIVRALESLKIGGVMAALVPASFLDGQSAAAIRAYISQSDEFQVRLIGHFQDFNYFDASVEPSFVVVSRSAREAPIRIVTAKSGFVDNAIRAIRSGKSITRAGYELYAITRDELSDRWTPLTQRKLRFVEALTTNTSQTVADFFVPRLGIRTGNKSVFIVMESDIDRVSPTKKERRFFRPVADRIEKGQIQPSGYVFYPYDTDGTLLLTSERQLREAVPRFYAERLRPAEKIL
ncbi:MAG: HsdM family class I SAM-dependent methyltransferase, partial [Pyrinomonadaceae bacterium]